MPKHPILITGTPRSGTTWIASMLALAKGTLLVHEPFNLESYAYKLDGLATRWLEYAPALNESEAMSAFRKVLDGETGRVFTRRQPQRYIRLLRRGRLIIKDPIASISAEWLSSRFPLKVVVVRRHPAAFVASMQKAGWKVRLDHLAEQKTFLEGLPDWLASMVRFPPKVEVERAAVFWVVVNWCLAEALKRNPEWIQVKHEEMAQHPIANFKRLYDHFGFAWDNQIERAIEKYSSIDNPTTRVTRTNNIRRNSIDSIEAWRHALTPPEISAVRAIAGEISGGMYSFQEGESGKRECRPGI